MMGSGGHGDFQHAGPYSHEGQVQDQEHDVADVHAGGDRPEKIGVLFKEQGPGASMDQQGPHHDRGRAEPGTPRTRRESWRRRAALLAASGAALLR